MIFPLLWRDLTRCFRTLSPTKSNVMKNFLLFPVLGIAMTIAACGGQSDAGTTAQTARAVVQNMDPAGFKKLIDSDAGTVIDVRTPQEHEAGFIKGTDLNIDITAPGFKDKIGQLDRNQTYLLYCRSGGRSARAAAIMESMGFKHIYNLENGYMGWKQAGLE